MLDPPGCVWRLFLYPCPPTSAMPYFPSNRWRCHSTWFYMTWRKFDVTGFPKSQSPLVLCLIILTYSLGKVTSGRSERDGGKDLEDAGYSAFRATNWITGKLFYVYTYVKMKEFGEMEVYLQSFWVSVLFLFLKMKANEIHHFSDSSDKVLYMFRTGPLSIIRSISTLCTRNRYLSC